MSKRVSTHPAPTTPTLLPSSSSTSGVAIDKILLSMLTYQGESWVETTHKWEFHPSESKEILHCCINEFNDENQKVNIGFKIWNLLDVDFIAFFTIDGIDMKKSLCPVVRHGQSTMSTASYQDSAWHSICIQRTKIADDPEEIDFDRLQSVGKIVVNVYKFKLEGVTSSNVNYDKNSTATLKDVKCKLTGDKNEISVTTGDKVENTDVSIVGHPDYSSRLKVFEIYYYTPQKYNELKSNKNLQENRRIVPEPTTDNAIALRNTSHLDINPVSKDSIPSSSVKPACSSTDSLPISNAGQESITPKLNVTSSPSKKTVNRSQTKAIPISLQQSMFSKFKVQKPTQEKPKQPQNIKKRKSSPTDDNVVVISSDDEDEDLANSTGSRSDSNISDSDKKKLKVYSPPRLLKDEQNAVLEKFLKGQEVLNEFKSKYPNLTKYNLQQVKNMTCEQMESFIGDVLGNRKHEFNLSIFEMNEIDGSVYVTKFSNLSQMGIDSELLEILEKILKLLF